MSGDNALWKRLLEFYSSNLVEALNNPHVSTGKIAKEARLAAKYALDLLGRE